MPQLNRREFAGLLAVSSSTGARLWAGTRAGATINETLRSGISQRRIPAAAGMAATESKILYSGAFGTRYFGRAG